MGWFKKAFSGLRKIDAVVNPLGGLGITEVLFKKGDVSSGNPAATTLKYLGLLKKTPAGKEQAHLSDLKAASDAKASAKAAALAQEKLGMQGQAEQLAKMRMRRGFLSTILSGGAAGSALSDMMAARKQLLGQ